MVDDGDVLYMNASANFGVCVAWRTEVHPKLWAFSSKVEHVCHPGIC